MNRNPIVSGWLIPLLQALTTGGLSAVAAYAVTAVAGWDRAIALAVFALVAFFAWLNYKHRWEYLLAALDGVEMADSAWPGSQPEAREPVPALETIRVELIQENGRRGDFIDLPVDNFQAHEVAHILSRPGASFSYATLAGPGKPLSRTEFEVLSRIFLTRGLAVWNNPRAHNQGMSLTAAGRAVLRKIADTRSPTGVYQVARDNHG